MDTFLFICSSEKPLAKLIDTSCWASGKMFKEEIGYTVKVDKHYCNHRANNFAWTHLKTSKKDHERLKKVSFYEDQDLFIITYGFNYYIDDELSSYIASKYKKNGSLNDIRSIDASFSCVLYNKVNNKLYSFSDISGMFSLSYLVAEGYIVVSPNDLLILSTGLIDYRIDYTSISSLLSFEWSLGGMSIIMGIDRMHPDFIYERQGNALVKTEHFLLQSNNRIEINNKKAKTKKVDEIIDLLRSKIKHISQSEDLVQVHLTAGLDSRVMLALVKSVVDNKRIRTCTGGDINNQDVRVANTISRLYGFEKNPINNDEILHPTAVNKNLMYLSFLTNGMVSGRFANTVDASEESQHEKYITFTGNGGEIYSGYYYTQSKKLYDKALLNNSKDSLDFFEKTINGYILPALTRNNADILRDRFRSVFDYYKTKWTTYSDVLDHFYLHDRNANFKGYHPSNLIRSKHILLYCDPLIIRNTFTLPAPIAQKHQLHRTVLKRFLKLGSILPLNGNNLIPLAKYPNLWHKQKVAFNYFNKLSRKSLVKQETSRLQGSENNELLYNLFEEKTAETNRIGANKLSYLDTVSAFNIMASKISTAVKKYQ